MEFTAETIARALTAIYGKEFDIDSKLEAHIFEETRKIFAQAVAEGIADSVEGGADVPGDEFLKALRESVDVFSAFRTHRMQNDIAAMMTDGKGQLKPFSRFAKDVRPYVSHKNRAWLRTEYDTAVRRAHQAADWQQFEAEKDVLPNLEWIPSTSPTPGADHRVFWGTVLPVDDPFWKEHRPGDRWNCKCELRATDKDCTARPHGTEKDNPQSGLENNPGKDGHLFSDKHPYYPDSCASCPYSGNKLMALLHDLAGSKKHCNSCRKVEKVIDKRIIEKAKAEFNGFSEQKYERTFFDNERGGYLVTEKDRIRFANKNKQELAKYKKEKNMCLVFAKGGDRIVHLGEQAGISSSDVLFNGNKADLKRTDSETNIVKYAKYASRHQGAKYVLFQFDKWNAKIANAIKELQRMKIHGKFFVTGKESEIKEF